MFTRYALIFLLLTSCRDGTQLPATSEPVEDSPGYKWKKLSDNGGFVPTDRIQFLNVRDTLWSFNANGNYYSTDGIHFLLSGLQPKVSSIGIPGYLYINNRLIAAIPTRGRSLIDSNTIEIFKSDDLLHWNFQRTATSLGLSTTSALIGFKGKIWIFGAKDSAGITSSWNSEDAVHWTKRADSLPFGAIRNQRIIVFKKKLLLLSHHLWESEDGIEWKKIRTTATPSFKQCTPVLYNNLLWVFGAGSSQEGLVKIMVSPDATKWDTMDAPWVERSSPALCVFRGKIFMGGGNHPVNSGKSSRDSLLNDIWQMEQ